MQSGLARLATGPSGEAIEISFVATYLPATAGSSAWSITASNVRVNLTMLKYSGPRFFLLRLRGSIADPYSFVEQYVILQRVTDAGYEGEVMLPLYILGGSDGQTQSHKQYLQFDRMLDDLTDDPDAMLHNFLIDPISQTSTFQIDMFASTPYAHTDMGTWS